MQHSSGSADQPAHGSDDNGEAQLSDLSPDAESTSAILTISETSSGAEQHAEHRSDSPLCDYSGAALNIDLTTSDSQPVHSPHIVDETNTAATFLIFEPDEHEEDPLPDNGARCWTDFAAPQPKDMETPGFTWYRYRDPTFHHTWFLSASEPNLWCYSSEVQNDRDANGNIFFLFQGLWQKVIDPPATSDSADQPADTIAADEEAAAPMPADEQPAINSAEQPTDSLLAHHIVLQSLESEGWLGAPLTNGCRLTELNRHCNKALAGWPRRLESLKYPDYLYGHLPSWNLRWVPRFCPQLKHLILPCPHIRRYDIDITEAVKDIAEGCPNLQTLEIGGHRISEAAIESVGQHCQDLKCLCMRGTNLTEDALYSVASGCPKLNKLDVSDTNVRNPSIAIVAQCCQQLRDLCVAECRYLTDEAIVSIASNCCQLQRLDVQDLGSLTDAAIEAVAQGCPHLKRLIARLCKRLTDRAIWSLAQGCRQLQDLDVCHCIMLTDVAILSLARNSTQLQWLCTKRCDRITWAAYDDLKKGCPQLKRWSW